MSIARTQRIVATVAAILWRYQRRFYAARLCAAFNDAPGTRKWLDDNLVLAVGRARAFLVGATA